MSVDSNQTSRNPIIESRTIKKNVSNSKRNAATHSKHFQVGDSAIFDMHWLTLLPKHKGRFRQDLLDSSNLYFKLSRELKRKKDHIACRFFIVRHSFSFISIYIVICV